MSCNNCQITICKTIYVHPCDSGIDTGIVLDETGDFVVYVSFGQSVQRYSIQVVEGEPIILHNVLNAPFVHTVTVYDMSGTLMNDTCYKLNTIPVITPNNLTPNPPCCAKKFITVTEAGATLTDDFFAVHIISEIDTSSQVYIKGADFTQTGDTITFTNSLSLSEGQIVLAHA